MVKGLKRRFIFVTALSVTLVMVFLSVLVNAAYYFYTDRELTNMLEFISENEGSIPVKQVEDRPPKMKNSGFTPETPFATRYFVLRFDSKGQLFNADLSHIAAVTKEDTENFIEIALKKGEGFGKTKSYKYYVVKNGENQYMAVFLNRYFEKKSAGMVLEMSVLADALCIVLVTVLAILLSGRAIEPVVRNVERQKQFITDASHELKTPLTVMTTSLKLLEMDVGEQKWIDKAQFQAKKMGELVNYLVILSRMDEEKPGIIMNEFDISEAVKETIESFLESAEAKGHNLIMNIESGIRLKGDENSVRQLISILTDNAIKYSLSDKSIYFTLKKDRKNVVIKTSNYCKKINKDELKKLFDRFYRADKSRTSSGAGFGVGLSIARSIAELHNGSIKAEMISDDMIEFTAVLKG